mmetsp:Transcript_31873/g.58372  ORF Transcript_31873/g.58372 Transcript_31873/m.58372 type:complete len:302 (+) Transcript_31873:81-986(+)
MPSGTYIDAKGNLVQPPRQEDDERLLPRRQALQQDVETGSTQTSNGWRFFGFPGFTWKSVIGVVVAIQLALYLVSCWIVPPRGTLSPSGGSLFKIGSSNSAAEMCAARYNFPYHLIELRRWFVPIFLHLNPMHIIMNCFFECSTGPRIEESMGALPFAVLFLGAGVMGNLLSDSFGVNGVGGSTSCYGLIGMNFALTYQRWPEMSQGEREDSKMQLMSTCGMLVLWEVIMWKEIDHWGHLGGFIGGFLIFLGRTDKRAAAAFALLVAICVYVICIKPLFSDTYNGYPWQAVCDSIWNGYSR